MIRNMLKSALCAIVVLAAGISFAAELSKSVPKGWIEDFDAAQKQAAKEGKYILLAFSGSDWCGWCVRMDREIYSDKKFVNQAKRDFILVMIDSPRDKSILSELAASQNRGLVRRFGVRGYPCSVLVRPDGSEVKRFSGYQSDGPSDFLKALKKAAADAGALAPQAEGAAKPAAPVAAK